MRNEGPVAGWLKALSRDHGSPRWPRLEEVEIYNEYGCEMVD